ncbi:MAG: hypothetical protein L6V93_20590 [Clostridiales bacterium]|nr:MAG: hypothetical protein L6V93_20590 [Clostridiales bacterium]
MQTAAKKTADAKIIEKDDRTVVYLEKEKNFQRTSNTSIFLYDYLVKNTGDEGYFITDMCLSGTAQTFF